ncbi:sulfate transporter family-domain-containing protein [Syncephalis plumigaleata]|nr:sulfate transporter family-domain-containing protein [Syncephalis plumigaleata]
MMFQLKLWQGGATSSIKRYVQQRLPIVGWLPYYHRSWFTRDIVAGFTIGVMIVPQSIAYARLAGLPVEYGLYSSMVAAAVYALFGTAKDINVGPTAVLSLYTGQGLHQIIRDHAELNTPAHMVALASMMALLTGGLVTLLGLLRIGILLDFISAPVVVGFTFGAGLDIMLTQIPKLLGVAGVNTNESFFNTIYELARRLKSISVPNLAVGLSATIMILSLKAINDRYGSRYRIARIVGIGRIAIIVVLYTLISFLIAVAGHGDNEETGQRHPLYILRHVPRGLPMPSMPSAHGVPVQQLLVASILPFLQTMIEHITMAKALGRINGYTVNSSQEMVALGFSNMATSFFSGFGVTGAMSRSMMVAQMGARTPLNSIFPTFVVCGSLLFLPPAFYYIPDSCLAAIITTSVFGLMRGPRTFIKLWRINPVDMITCLAAFIFTVLFNIAIGIGVAVGLSLVLMLYKVARPDCILLEPCVDNPDVYVDPSLPDVVTKPPPPGIIIFRVEEAIIFPNAHYIRHRLLKVVHQTCASGKPPVTLEDEMWCDVGTAATAAAKKQDLITNSACNCNNNSHHDDDDDDGNGASSSNRFSKLRRLFQRRRRRRRRDQRCTHENNNAEMESQSAHKRTPNTTIDPSHYTQRRNSLSIVSIEMDNVDPNKINDDLTQAKKVESNQHGSFVREDEAMSYMENNGKNTWTGRSETRPLIKAVIMDFSAVNNIDASGLQVLLDLKSTISEYAGNPTSYPFQMHFVSVKKRVLRVLELSGITNTVLPVLEDERVEEVFEQNKSSTSNDQVKQQHASLTSVEAHTDPNLNQAISDEEQQHNHGPITGITNNIPIARPIVTQDQRLVHLSIADAVREVLRRHELHLNKEHEVSNTC